MIHLFVFCREPELNLGMLRRYAERGQRLKGGCFRSFWKKKDIWGAGSPLYHS